MSLGYIISNKKPNRGHEAAFCDMLLQGVQVQVHLSGRIQRILIDDDNCGDTDTADGPDVNNEKRKSPNAELDYEYTQDVD